MERLSGDPGVPWVGGECLTFLVQNCSRDDATATFYIALYHYVMQDLIESLKKQQRDEIQMKTTLQAQLINIAKDKVDSKAKGDEKIDIVRTRGFIR